ncbi:hypothetical protein C1A50_2951 [Paenibacillus polymyxa]|jgi:hypothetical protein|nr:hypothetical protein C1A50_2951 [Paenibacillus polymyxa]
MFYSIINGIKVGKKIVLLGNGEQDEVKNSEALSIRLFVAS